MRVAIIGGGASGAAIRAACEDLGAEATIHSRATGFDVTQPSQQAVQADVLVEATNIVATGRQRCVDFLTRSTRVVSMAARQAGARHMVLSIVNAHLPSVQGFGYFAGKAAQERLARELSPQVQIVRTTQWFEFGSQVVQRNRVGPFGLVPGMMIQPLALAAAARVVAEVAVGQRHGQVVEVAGPQQLSLWKLVQRVPRPRGIVPVPVFLPTASGRAFRTGALLPGPGVEVVGPSLSEWLGS